MIDTPLMSFTQHQKDITCLEFTENLNYLVSASMDRTVRVWNLDDASLVRIIFFPEVIRTFKLTMNGDIIICGGEEGNIFVWNLVKPIKIHSFSLKPEDSPQPIVSIKMSTDERFVLISSSSRLAYCMTHRLRDDRHKDVYESHYGHVNHKSLAAVNMIDIDRLITAAVNSRNDVVVVKCC